MMRSRKLWLIIAGAVAVLAITAVLVYRWYSGSSDSNHYIRLWLTDRDNHPELASDALSRCPGAPFVLPSSGFVGLLWGDDGAPYTALRRHTGIDIFGDGVPGTVPIYAAYDGYLTRKSDWLSTVIIRHDDPLQPGRTIWTYYTHMASRDGSQSFVTNDFPRGTTEVFVQQGTLLGYQGDFAGNAPPVATHLHMSIVTSDADGLFRNEAIFANTLDPSPYFGMDLTLSGANHRPPQCQTQR